MKPLHLTLLIATLTLSHFPACAEAAEPSPTEPNLRLRPHQVGVDAPSEPAQDEQAKIQPLRTEASASILGHFSDASAGLGLLLSDKHSVTVSLGLKEDHLIYTVGHRKIDTKTPGWNTGIETSLSFIPLSKNTGTAAISSMFLARYNPSSNGFHVEHGVGPALILSNGSLWFDFILCRVSRPLM